MWIIVLHHQSQARCGATYSAEMHSCLDKWFSKRVKKCQFPKSAQKCMKSLKPTPPNFYIYHDAVQRVHVNFDLGFINESNFLRVIFLHNPWLSRYDTCYAKDCFVIMPLIVPPKRSLWTRTVLQSWTRVVLQVC